MLSPLVIPKVGNPGSVLLIDDINESFLFAIKNEHLQDARLCLEKEANIDTRTENFGYSCLHFVARSGNLELVNFLVDRGANINARDHHLCTPLHWAVSNGHLLVIKYLVEKSADIEATDEDGHSLLHWASNKGHLEVVAFLVKDLLVDVNAVDKYGRIPLHYCARNGHLQVLSFLLESGAESKLGDDVGDTPYVYSSPEVREHLKAKEALNLMNYVEYVVCKDFRSHQKVGRPSTNNAPVFSERSIKKEISMRVLQAADMKARLIALHLAIEDRYATLEREGDVEGFAMCMKYQDQIYLLVCPDDPLPNPEIRRPLLTALTLAHYVQCAEYSIQTEVYQLRNSAAVGESNINIERSDLHCTYQFISSEQLTFNLNKLNEQLSDRYNMLSLGRDTVGCAIVLQYQDKIKNLLYHSKQ